MNNSNLNKFVAKRIRFFRIQKKLTQEELSEKAGLGINYINNIENKDLNIKIETLEKIIKSLEIDYRNFFGIPYESNKNIENIIEKINNLDEDKQIKVLNVIDEIINIIK